MPISTGDEFVASLNQFDVRVFPPRTELKPADIMPALENIIEGDDSQKYQVAKSLSQPINDIIKQNSRRGVGFMYRDPATNELTYLNRRNLGFNQETKETLYGWVKGRTVQTQS